MSTASSHKSEPLLPTRQVDTTLSWCRVTCERIVYDKATGEQSTGEVTVTADEGVRPSTLEGVKGLRTVIEGGTITAGNASQLSDGASAQVVMSSDLATSGT